MKSFFYTLLMAPLAFMLLTNGHALAQADNPSQQCDKVLDITDTASQAAPLVLEGNESLCLDSEQIATWFVDQGGWTSELTSDRLYWQLTPPGPTRAIFTLHLPSGDQQKLRVLVNSAETESTEAEPTNAKEAEGEPSQN
nr:hypothetical protein [uncultured Halomonas sp.]